MAITGAEQTLGELRVRASQAQAEQLLAWAAAWPQRTWAIEDAGGLGHLLAQQLLAAGEQVLDVHPKLGARVRLLATGDISKNDPNDARSVAVAALRSASCPELTADDHPSATYPVVMATPGRTRSTTPASVPGRWVAVAGAVILISYVRNRLNRSRHGSGPQPPALERPHSSVQLGEP